MSRIVPLATVDPDAVEALLDAAFGRDRHARTAYRIRDGMAALADLSFAAVAADRALLGTLQSWPVALVHAEQEEPLVLVGPVAVAPERQGTGVGRALMAAMLDAADRSDAPAQVLIGDPEYYERFGFTAEATGGWKVPGPVERHRLLARTGGWSLPAAGLLAPRGWTAPHAPR